MKFLIVNSFHRDDKGDAALVHVLIDQLLAIDPYAEIKIASMEDPEELPSFYKGTNIGSFELYSSSRYYSFPTHLFIKIYFFLLLTLTGNTGDNLLWLLPKKLKNIYEACQHADLVVSVGGGYFATKQSLGSRIHLLFALQTLILAKSIGATVVTAPISVGPFEKNFEANYTAHRLKKLDLVLLRENISKKYFLDKNDQLPSNIKRVPDSGFAFSPKGDFNIRSAIKASTKDPILMLSVRNWLSKEGQDIYEQAHADLIDYIAIKHPKIRPVFIYQCTFLHVDEDDRVVSKRILDRSKSKNAILAPQDLTYEQTKLAYREADFVVGTRFHALVFGLSYNVPGIAIEYEHKTRGIMEDIGLEKWVLPIRSISSQNLITLFEKLTTEREKYRNYLIKFMPSYIKSANEVVPLFSKMLK